MSSKKRSLMSVFGSDREALKNDVDSLRTSLEDLMLKAGPKGEGIGSAAKEKSRPPFPLLSYHRGTVGGKRSQLARNNELRYEPPHYDLIEIARARDIESLFQTSVERHVEEATRQGWEFQGEDPAMVDYIYRRVFEMEVLTQKTFDEVIAEALEQAVTYGTLIVVARRDETRSSGRPIKKFGKVLAPIATFEVGDAPQFEVAVNRRGNVVAWKQNLYGSNYAASWYNASRQGENTRQFYWHDVYYGARNRQPGRVFGRPMVISVLDDIDSLRRMEELADIIPQKHLFPLFQYIVGTEESPAGEIELADGTKISELEYAKLVIDSMPTEGGFVTPERHTIELIGAKDKVLDLMPYIEHFFRRVQQGLRMPDTVLGKGNSEPKATATHQAKSLQESARSLQKIVESVFGFLIMDLLLEGGYSVTHENKVILNLIGPDVEDRRAQQTHDLNIYQSGGYDEDELRRKLGMKKFTQDQKNKTVPEQEHRRQKELDRISAAKRAATSSAKRSSAKKSTSNRAQPRNQSGKKSTKTRITKNDSYYEEVVLGWKRAERLVLDNRNHEDHLSLVSDIVSDIVAAARKYLGPAAHEGILDARRLSGDSSLVLSKKEYGNLFGRLIRQDILRVFRSCLGNERLRDKNIPEVIATFAVHLPILDRAISKHEGFVKRCCTVEALKIAGIDRIAIQDSSNQSSTIMSTRGYSSKLLLLTDGDVTIEALDG